MDAVKHIDAGVLNIAYLDIGEENGWPCVLAHGWPYDVHAYEEVAPILVGAGARVFVPFVRGFGPTRFLDDKTPRSGEQAVLGNDLKSFMDALGIEKAVLGGYDWGGRGCCIVSALWPERVVGLVSGGSYNIQNIPRCMEPGTPAEEASFWYQYFFHTERGVRAMTDNRDAFIRYIWKIWSMPWDFDDATFAKSQPAFQNPDFVEITIHSYRHRYGLVPGDPAVAHIETMLTAQPKITVPAITVDGTANGVDFGSPDGHAKRFTGPHVHQIWEGVGHNIPQEAPRRFAAAILKVREMAG